MLFSANAAPARSHPSTGTRQAALVLLAPWVDAAACFSEAELELLGPERRQKPSD